MTPSEAAAPTAKTAKTKTLTVSDDLHGKLKDKAKREGRKLQPMVEEKLKELFAGEQLELLEAAK